MRLKSVKVLILSFIVLGMLNIPMVQAGKPHDVRAGEYGQRINWWDPDSRKFSEDTPTYYLIGWAYLEEEWKVYPMPVKVEVHWEDVEFKMHRFTINSEDELHVKPIFFFYVLFEPYTFSPGEHYLDIFFTFHGERCWDINLSLDIIVYPEDMPM
ncbi:MAG: hypothetical protein ACTSPA_05890 [Promethearchaeota archaeon]